MFKLLAGGAVAYALYKMMSGRAALVQAQAASSQEILPPPTPQEIFRANEQILADEWGGQADRPFRGYGRYRR